ncbi:hypothetical protein EVAR_45976_1 [Eumeta japonica]|uniref:Uncharacterized protein n=1 Tax=Eumeta variegata TaxID=151549 RepID=A0A4C1YLP8_EUMVA|nr:hypothetical protein EVAR_45976_1 [Eumeta japonica]
MSLLRRSRLHVRPRPPHTWRPLNASVRCRARSRALDWHATRRAPRLSWTGDLDSLAEYAARSNFPAHAWSRSTPPAASRRCCLAGTVFVKCVREQRRGEVDAQRPRGHARLSAGAPLRERAPPAPRRARGPGQRRGAPARHGRRAAAPTQAAPVSTARCTALAPAPHPRTTLLRRGYFGPSPRVVAKHPVPWLTSLTLVCRTPSRSDILSVGAAPSPCRERDLSVRCATVRAVTRHTPSAVRRPSLVARPIAIWWASKRNSSARRRGSRRKRCPVETSTPAVQCRAAKLGNKGPVFRATSNSRSGPSSKRGHMSKQGRLSTMCISVYESSDRDLDLSCILSVRMLACSDRG